MDVVVGLVPLIAGIIIAGHRPGDAGKLLDMPGIWGKPTAGFVTYALHAGKVVRALADIVALQGGDWLGGRAFKRSDVPDGIAGFVVAAIDAAQASSDNDAAQASSDNDEKTAVEAGATS